MGRRQDFHEILVQQYEGLTSDGRKCEPCVKYQPGPSVTLTYPAIIYKLDDMPAIHADNHPYAWGHRYQVTVVDRKADSVLRERVQALPTCRMKTAPYSTDNLYHFVFTIYY